jgi:hypothetical protein
MRTLGTGTWRPLRSRVALTALPFLLALLVLPFPGAGRAQDDPSPFEQGGEIRDDGAPAATDASTPMYLKALELQRKGKFKDAQRLIAKLLQDHPGSVHRVDAEFRGGDNFYAGCVKLHESGPSSRRIDVAVMGDGFTVDAKDQKLQEAWARLCLDVLWSEAAFEEYKDYFNYYFVRLVSKDEGVSKIYTDEERAELEERKRRRKKVELQEYSTALDCKAAGPQGQVMADRALVYKWLEYANREVPGSGDDALVIAFARFGKLGMGGGGIANVGRPDESITVHEFGHAFVGLLDEYANNPGPPTYDVRAPNATTDKDDVPWQHWLERKTSGVGVFEGGATYKTGVWRPARTCAMNAAGARGFCPVCRETAVLRIYSYVSPIDTTSPAPMSETRAVKGDGSRIVVTPMRPLNHDLSVEWYVDRVPDSEPGPRAGERDTRTLTEGAMGSWTGGTRGQDRDGDAYEFPPFGYPSDLGKVEKKGRRAERHVFPVGDLDPGRYVVTVRVWDPTGWVLKDTKKLLEERASFWVTVSPRN